MSESACLKQKVALGLQRKKQNLQKKKLETWQCTHSPTRPSLLASNRARTSPKVSNSRWRWWWNKNPGKRRKLRARGSRKEQGTEEFPSDLKEWEMALPSRHKLSKEQPRPNTRRAARTYLTPGQRNCTGSPFLARFRRFHLQHNHRLQRGLGDLQPARGHTLSYLIT